MPSLTGSTVTAKQLDAHLRGSPLAGTGAAFVAAGRRYRVDPRLLVSIASAESSLGAHAQGHNPFGWGPGIHFNSWGEAIDTVARGLRTNYLGKGLKTIEQIGAKYAPSHVANDPTGLNSNWVKNVKAMYAQLGGRGNLGAPEPPGAPRSVPELGAGKIDLRPLVEQNLLDFGGHKSPTSQLNDLAQFVRSTPVPPTGPVTKAGVKSLRTTMPVTGSGYAAWVPGRTGVGGRHQTSGLAGYPAVDVFGKAGTPVVSPVNGTVVKLSGHDPSQGAVEGAGGPFGWSAYIRDARGRTWYITHLGTRPLKVGEKITRGMVIGTIGNYPGRASHAHIGLQSP